MLQVLPEIACDDVQDSLHAHPPAEVNNSDNFCVQVECGVCCEQYTTTAPMNNSSGARDHRPVIMPCGHSVCKRCFDSLHIKKCPYCKYELINEAPFNYAMIDLLDSGFSQSGDPRYFNGKMRELEERVAQMRELEERVAQMRENEINLRRENDNLQSHFLKQSADKSAELVAVQSELKKALSDVKYLQSARDRLADDLFKLQTSRTPDFTKKLQECEWLLRNEQATNSRLRSQLEKIKAEHRQDTTMSSEYWRIEAGLAQNKLEELFEDYKYSTSLMDDLQRENNELVEFKKKHLSDKCGNIITENERLVQINKNLLCYQKMYQAEIDRLKAKLEATESAKNNSTSAIGNQVHSGCAEVRNGNMNVDPLHCF